MWNLISPRTRSAASSARRRPRDRRAARPSLESLEGRVVLSTVAFDSVLDVGNDTASIIPNENAVDKAGNTYVTGLLYGRMDLDPNVDHADGSDILTPAGSSSAYIAKYAPDNTLVWARQVGSSYLRLTNANDPFEQGRGIAVDAAGNVYATGDFVGTVTLGSTTLTGTGSTDVFVAKLDPNGNFLWANSWGASATREFGKGIAVDGAGNVIAAGFTANLTSNGAWWTSGMEIHKYSPTGAASWGVRYDNTGGTADDVSTDAAGNVYVCGSFNGTLNFNAGRGKTAYVSGAAGYGGGQAFNGYVLKLTASGSFGWVAPFIAKTGEVANSAIYCNSLALDAGGNVLVGGAYRGQDDIDPRSKVDTRLPKASTSVNDGYVAKLSPAGALVWATPLGGGSVRDLAVDGSGNAYATGAFYETFSPGGGLPSVTTQGSDDIFAVKLTAAGRVDWAVTFGGISSDYFRRNRRRHVRHRLPRRRVSPNGRLRPRCGRHL